MAGHGQSLSEHGSVADGNAGAGGSGRPAFAAAMSMADRRELGERITDAHLKYLALMAALAAVLLAFVLIWTLAAYRAGSVRIALPEFWRLPVIVAGGGR